MYLKKDGMWCFGVFAYFHFMSLLNASSFLNVTCNTIIIVIFCAYSAYKLKNIIVPCISINFALLFGKLIDQ